MSFATPRLPCIGPRALLNFMACPFPPFARETREFPGSHRALLRTELTPWN